MRDALDSLLFWTQAMQTFLDKMRSRALAVMAHGGRMEPFLREFCAALQVEIPDSIVGVTALDRSGQTVAHAVFPSLPPAFEDFVKGRVVTGDELGSCGVAVISGEIVETADIEADRHTTHEWRALCCSHGVRSIISVPALGVDGRAEGAIAVAFRGGQTLTPQQRAGVELAASLCAAILIYSRRQASQQLLVGELEHRIRNLFSTFAGVASMTLRDHQEPLAFNKALSRRLVSMAKAHAFAMGDARVNLAGLAREVVSAYATEQQIDVDGPPIVLAKDAAVVADAPSSFR